MTTRWTGHVGSRHTFLVGKIEDLSINGKIILKWIFLYVMREDLRWVDLCEGEDSWREGGLEMCRSV